MTVKDKTKSGNKRLKTIQMTSDFERNLAILRKYGHTTDAKAIRDAVKTLAMERTGELQITKRQ
jgi:hypothetical protein